MSTNGNAACRRGGRGGTPALLLFLACAASTALCDDAQPLDEGRKLQLPPEAVAHRVIHMDIAPFLSPLVQRVSLPLPDGSSLLIRRARLERPSGNTYVWHGKVEKDDRSIATFAIAPPDLVVGDVVTSAGKMYRVEYLAAKTQVVMELDPARFPAGAPGVPLKSNPPPGGTVTPGVVAPPADSASSPPAPVPQPPSSSPQGTGSTPVPCPADGADRIDVMVVYTEGACAAAVPDGGTVCTTAKRAAIELKIHQAVGEANASYINSGINQHLSLVVVGTTGSYVEAATLLGDLDRLREKAPEETIITGAPAQLDDVHVLRDQHAADAVVLITKPTNLYSPAAPSGIANQMGVEDPSSARGAFAVVPLDCATGDFSFAHELGHVMGADHDEESFPTVHPFIFSHGLVTPKPSGMVAPWRTVMAENTSACMDAGPVGCIRLANWSNQDKTHGGDSMGTATADNRKALNETADTVANYRVSCKRTPGPPANVSVQ